MTNGFDWDHPYITDYVFASKMMLRYWKLKMPVPEKAYNEYYRKLHRLREWLDGQGYRMRRPKY